MLGGNVDICMCGGGALCVWKTKYVIVVSIYSLMYVTSGFIFCVLMAMWFIILYVSVFFLFVCCLVCMRCFVFEVVVLADLVLVLLFVVFLGFFLEDLRVCVSSFLKSSDFFFLFFLFFTSSYSPFSALLSSPKYLCRERGFPLGSRLP